MSLQDPSLYETVVSESTEALTEAKIIANRLVVHYLKSEHSSALL